MRILVDAMGGDNAPDQIALGAIQAAKDFGCEVVLVGRGEAILRALKDQGIETLPKGVEIANADDVVDMHDDPATVVKKKKDSSMVVGLNMLKEGGGEQRAHLREQRGPQERQQSSEEKEKRQRQDQRGKATLKVKFPPQIQNDRFQQRRDEQREQKRQTPRQHIAKADIKERCTHEKRER